MRNALAIIIILIVLCYAFGNHCLGDQVGTDTCVGCTQECLE